MNSKKLGSLLGLSRRAGKVSLGTDSVLDNLGSKKIFLIFVASDASPATIDKVIRKGFYYKIPVVKSFDTLFLDKSLGTSNIKVLGILDKGFSTAMLKEVSEVEGE